MLTTESVINELTKDKDFRESYISCLLLERKALIARCQELTERINELRKIENADE